METLSLSGPPARFDAAEAPAMEYTRRPVNPKNAPVLGSAAVESESRAGDGSAVRGRSDYDDFGDRVAGVLAAAEQAAAQIREDAALEAERLRVEADQYAADVRNAVDSYAQKHRRDAEGEVRETLASAQAEARAMREAAQAMAGQLEEEARRAREGLLSETRALEDRRGRALDDLRDIAATLQDLVVGSADTSGRADASTLRRQR